MIPTRGLASNSSPYGPTHDPAFNASSYGPQQYACNETSADILNQNSNFYQRETPMSTELNYVRAMFKVSLIMY
ncbi:unnamed protein product [Rotaria sp. Silwood2]|nr:unnamed protein product [Rotaria sp. Silwood2]CAF3315960.1 unnamed protein product [Rotaria sp. Silwood2]